MVTRRGIGWGKPRRDRLKNVENMRVNLHLKALLFDVFGAIVNWQDSIAREFAAFLERHRAG